MIYFNNLMCYSHRRKKYQIYSKFGVLRHDHIDLPSIKSLCEKYA